MADVKIITFNCTGMANSIRRTALFEIFRRLPAQIILTQETHSKPEDEAIWAREWAPRTVDFNSAKNTTSYPRNGVEIFINDPNIKVNTVKKDLEGRILTADVSIHFVDLHLINIYVPVEKNSAKNEIFDSLYPYTISSLPVVMAGDFKVVDQPNIDRLPPGDNAERRKALISLCNFFQLTDAYRDLYRDARTYTRRQGTSHSRLDRFHISREINPSNQLTISSTLSDHDIVVLQIKNIQNTQRGKGIWKNNTKIYDLQSFQN